MSVKIHNKEYITVNERLTEFREKYEGYNLTSEIVQLNENSCVIKATITDQNGMVRATGHAQEDRTSSQINKTSFVENCETSAWGRALANLGIGIESSVASAEEVAIAIAKQEMHGGQYKFGSGKYAGKTIAEVGNDDIEYLQLLLDSEQVPEVIKENIREYFKK